MKVIIETKITGENGGSEVFTHIINQNDLTNIVKTQGIEAGNAALDKFTDTYIQAFKQKLSLVLNR